MKILLIGTGAVGSFFGGKIARYSGADITFFSRGKSYKAIKDRGLVLDSIVEDSFAIKVNIVETLNARQKYDLIIIATKSYDLSPLLDNLPDSLFEQSYFMTTQNGVMSEDELLERIDEERLIPASAFIGVKKTGANTMYHTGGGRFQFGSYDRQEKTGFLLELFKVFEEAKIDVIFSQDIMKLKWGKLVWNAAYNPISTISQFKLGDILENQYGLKLLRGSMNETVAVAKSYGHNISQVFIDKQIDLPKNLYSFKTSMLQDYLNKRPLELESILGDLVRRAEANGIPSPVNSYSYNMLKLIVRE